MPDTSNYADPRGSAQERMARLGNLEDGEAAKAADQPFYENANNVLIGGDVGWATASVLDAGVTAGASGSAIAGALAVELAPVAIAIGGAWALDKLGVTDAMSNGFVRLGDELGLTIGHGEPHPACVGDAVAHSTGAMGIFGGMLAGVAVGAIVAAAVVATAATGGLAGALIIGACMAGGLSLGSALASASQQMGSDCGQIMTGSSNVFFEGKRVARVTDLVKCDHHSGSPQALVEGSKTVFVNGLPLVRIGHETHCSAKVNAGRNSIWIDKTTAQYGPKNPEVTAGEAFWASLLGALAGGAIGRTIGKEFKPTATESAEQRGIKDEQRKCAQDPVDVASGEVLETRTDLSIPGVLPLELRRRYRTRSDDSGLLGPRWSDNWSQRLSFDGGRFVRFHDGAGLALGFDAPDMALNGINLREPRYRLVGSRAEPRVLDYDTRQLRIFAPLVEGATSRLVRIEDLDGNSIDFGYDEHGYLSRLTHSDGYRLEVSHRGSQGSCEKIVLHDADGQVRTLVDYSYHEGMLAHVASFQRGQLHYSYDEHGWMTQWHDSDQTDVRYRYDESGRVIETGTAQGFHTGRFVYGSGNTRVIDADGEWLYVYNEDGLVTEERNPLGHSTRTEWKFGRLMARVDSIGNRTEFRYDEHGKLMAVAKPAGRVIRFEYDDEQRLTATYFPGGGKIALEYDQLRRVVKRSEPDGNVTAYRYGARGELLRVIQGERETRLDYDDRLRLTDIHLPGGAHFHREVDVFGRVLKQTAPDGNITLFDYTASADNPRGSLRSVTKPDGSTSHARYNREGLPVEWIDPLSRSTQRSYGPFDLLRASTDAAGQTTRFEYDHAARLTKIVNALGETWTYRYDVAGRLSEEVDWGGRATYYERDAIGRLLVKTQPDGGQWRYAYDALDRLSVIDAGDVKLGYRYDAWGRLASAEVQEQDHTHVTRFAYDKNGRLIGEDQHGELLRHIYDANGQRTLRITPHRETAYAYDTLGALTQVGGLSIQRDELGRETGCQAGDFIAQQQFDALGRIRRELAGPVSAFEALKDKPVQAFVHLTRHLYHYDAAGQLERFETEADTFTYQRDVRGQVIKAESLLQLPEHFSYDAAMNVSAHGHQGAVDTHHYGRGGLPERVGHTRFRYDARGRTVEKTVERPGFRPKTWHYTWDGLNRLVKIATPERGVWVYRYDALNRRVEKRQIGAREAIKFLWDGSTLVERWLQTRDGTTDQAVTWHIEPTGFTPLAQETDEGLFPVLTDQIGSPRTIFDQSGDAVWKASYSLWGRLVPSKHASNDEAGPRGLDTTLRFPGQWADDESGLSYNFNRYYDTDTAQYLSPDPIGLEGGFRTQGYVTDPCVQFDPLGLAECSAQDDKIDKGLSGRGVRPGPGERSLTREQYRDLISRTRNQGDALQAALDRQIASQDYVYRATTLRSVDIYRAQGGISGYKGAGTYMSTEYVGTDPAVLMDRAQVFQHWGAPEALLKIPTSELSSATVPRPFGGKLSVGWEPETSVYPAAGSGGQNQFFGTTNTWSDDWIVPLDKP